jgi:hypothetical protein
MLEVTREAERQHAEALREALERQANELDTERRAAVDAAVGAAVAEAVAEAAATNKEKAFYNSSDDEDDSDGGAEGDVYDCETHELHEVSQSRRKHARAFAQSVFADAMAGLESLEQREQGVLTKKDVRTYFKAHPIEKAHILSERFKWPVFFEGAKGAAEGSKVVGIDLFTLLVVDVYHDGLFFSSDDARALGLGAGHAVQVRLIGLVGCLVRLFGGV